MSCKSCATAYRVDYKPFPLPGDCSECDAANKPVPQFFNIKNGQDLAKFILHIEDEVSLTLVEPSFGPTLISWRTGQDRFVLEAEFNDEMLVGLQLYLGVNDVDGIIAQSTCGEPLNSIFDVICEALYRM